MIQFSKKIENNILVGGVLYWAQSLPASSKLLCTSYFFLSNIFTKKYILSFCRPPLHPKLSFWFVFFLLLYFSNHILFCSESQRVFQTRTSWNVGMPRQILIFALTYVCFYRSLDCIVCCMSYVKCIHDACL